ncbi:MAG: 16S rRNA pseudouridine(516) synthase, partial [Erysipelotrichaceae bacterium]|nr:16S rRNA pseudouridine(516) synthase [Erysipelotrichaceae bacterium]
HVDKEYEVDLAKDWDPRYEMELSNGILIQDPEYQCKPASVIVIEPKKIRITISEGKYHQVKRMMVACDNEVVHLRRIRMGGLNLDPQLHPGEFRPLTSLELEQLQKTHG